MTQKIAKIKINAVTVGLLMRTLHEGPSSLNELMDVTGLANSTIRGYIKELRKHGLVYLAGYDRAGNNVQCIELYAWGPGMKDYKPKFMTGAERSRKYREQRRLMTIHNLGATSEVS